MTDQPKQKRHGVSFVLFACFALAWVVAFVVLLTVEPIFPGWFWKIMQIGTGFGAVFVPVEVWKAYRAGSESTKPKMGDLPNPVPSNSGTDRKAHRLDALSLSPRQVLWSLAVILAIGGLTFVYLNPILATVFLVVWLAVLGYAAG